jgi:hypothetical protein
VIHDSTDHFRRHPRQSADSDMTLLLPSLAVAFAASCVWLGVRIINRRERWAKWTLVVIVALAYPASRGPWCYLAGMCGTNSPLIKKTMWLYQPLISAEHYLLPESFAERYRAYLGWWRMQGVRTSWRDPPQGLAAR